MGTHCHIAVNNDEGYNRLASVWFFLPDCVPKEIALLSLDRTFFVEPASSRENSSRERKESFGGDASNEMSSSSLLERNHRHSSEGKRPIIRQLVSALVDTLCGLLFLR